MTSHRLLLSISKRNLQRLPATDFLWCSPPKESSFFTDIGPRLGKCRGAQRRNVEFLRLAALAYLVDRTTPRPRWGWLRELRVRVPVWDPGPWNQVAGEIEGILGFLTSDRWRIEFVGSRTPRSDTPSETLVGPAAALFSGGADSLVGAILAEGDLGTSPILVSHWDWPRVAGFQNTLSDELMGLWGYSPPRFQVRVGRSTRQLGSGMAFDEEPTSRTRSVLFIALGLAVASSRGVPLLIPENGFASLNPPMGGERRGALSTRTTHPLFLTKLGKVLCDVGAHAQMKNPFASQTKGEMFVQVAQRIGRERAAKILSRSNSCSRGDVRFAGVSGKDHCGVCFGCLVRRAGFATADVGDTTGYLIKDLTTRTGAFNGWYSEKRRRDLEAVRYAAHRGVDESDVTRNLPPQLDPELAIDVASRGLAELAELVL